MVFRMSDNRMYETMIKGIATKLRVNIKAKEKTINP